MNFYTKQIHSHLKKIAPVTCATTGCKNKRAFFIQYRMRKDGVCVKQYKQYQFCSKCRSRQLKEIHPVTYYLNILRGHARHRGIPCTLSMAEFKQFCATTGYIQRVGQSPESLTIDRIDHDKGYHIWNIRVLTHAENSNRGHALPGKDVPRNTKRPTEWLYSFAGPESDRVINENQPF